ncbi:hypothetical protein F2P79_005912 [Pimephales promelas]|nr:hypothetical protein F2P79_005912 [Pimephales promelas]
MNTLLSILIDKPYPDGCVSVSKRKSLKKLFNYDKPCWHPYILNYPSQCLHFSLQNVPIMTHVDLCKCASPVP